MDLIDSCPLTADEQALAGVMRRTWPGIDEGTVAVFATNGWTARAYASVEALAEWVVAEGLLGWEAGRQTPAGMLGLLWESLVGHHGLSGAEAYRWLAVLAGAPDADSFRLGSALIATAADRDPVGAARRALGPVAPLAYAAGFGLTEAGALHTAGRLDRADLVVLATLRGYRLPPALLATLGPEACSP